MAVKIRVRRMTVRQGEKLPPWIEKLPLWIKDDEAAHGGSALYNPD
jgi:hypothetical protein